MCRFLLILFIAAWGYGRVSAATIDSVEVRPAGDSVSVAWTSDDPAPRYALWRANIDDLSQAIDIEAPLISGTDSVSPTLSNLSFADLEPGNGACFYWIEAVIGGVSEFHGAYPLIRHVYLPMITVF